MVLNPVIKWSGSKRTQAKEIFNSIPNKEYETYYEPFCGGCSVIYYILNNCPTKFKKYICSDINKPLIDLWNKIKNNPLEVALEYGKLWYILNKQNNDIIRNEKEYKINFFNSVREQFNKTQDPLLFFFIMRTTTNGMPRYNNKGEFNNSFHITRNGMKPETLSKIIFEWSDKLNQYDVQFKHCSYNEVHPLKNDFMYLDPPYANTKGMYYGKIDYNLFWDYLKKLNIDYLLSFDGVAGKENLIYNVPKDCYTDVKLIKSGNSSFRRVIGNSKDIIVYESLYIKERING